MAAQPLLVVEHATPVPALDGIVAGALAASLAAPDGGRLPSVRLHGRQDIDERVASREHVAAHGALWPNGSLWLERSGDSPLPPTAAAAIDGGEPIAAGVVAFNPLACRPMSRSEAARALAIRCQDALWLTVRETGDGLTVADAHGAPILPALARDASGRISGVPGVADAAALRVRFALRASGPAPASAPGPTVLVVGEESIHREVYPAACAALADAGDALGLAPRLRIQSPRGVDA
ncbi:MAG: hypothetical protein JNK11_11080, partial [Alphaproteobacteria bacterium]|nr:hypothetical protein [Alphaproteobacteria bacterium]